MRSLNRGEVYQKEIGGRARSAGDAQCAMLGLQGIKDTFELVKHELFNQKKKKMKPTSSASKYNICFNHLWTILIFIIIQIFCILISFRGKVISRLENGSGKHSSINKINSSSCKLIKTLICQEHLPQGFIAVGTLMRSKTGERGVV